MKAAKVDDNQGEIVDFFRSIGCSVSLMHAVGRGFPDLIIGKHGLNILVEVKDGKKSKSAQSLTPSQEIWHSEWKGQKSVVNSIDSALSLAKQYKFA